MEFPEALFKKIETLREKAVEFRDRDEEIRRTGGDAGVTLGNLISTCEEIGRLNDQLRKELDKVQSDSSGH